MKKIMSALVIALTALVMALAGQSSAAASPAVPGAETAYLQRELTLSPSAPAGSTADVSRDIYLAAGRYTWYLTSRLIGQNVDAFDGRTIVLAEGKYHWYMSYTKWDSGDGYRVFSSLRMGNSPAAELKAFFGVGSSPGYYRMLSELSQY